MRAFPKISKSSDLMRENLGSLMKTVNSLRLEQDDSGRATIFGNPIHTLGGGELKTNEIVYE